MKTLALSLVLAVGAVGCGDDDYEPPRPLTAKEQALVSSSNSFGFDFFAQIVSDTPDQNVFVSPLSVSMALGMTYNGARGTTADGMGAALAYGDMELDDVNQSYDSLIALLTGMDPGVTVEIANSVWYRQGFEVLAEFLDACQSYFSAVVQALDFNDPSSVDTINNWVSENTNGKIDEIIDGIDSMSMMFLINAVYFKGDWTTQFDRDDTTTDTFKGAGGNTDVQMMTLTEAELDYHSTDTFQAVRLPYGHEHFAMTVILPRESSSMDGVVGQLSTASWDEWQSSFNSQEIPLYLPRFELEYEATLNQTLEALGMEEAFNPNLADFSGISNAALYISEVKHKTYVKVNEEGTEAAAVTSVDMRVTSMPEEMRVDRPFIVVIHDTHSQALLFMGRILDL